jgi:hypothetical protein
MSRAPDYMYRIGCDLSQTIQWQVIIINCLEDLRIVRITLEICFETSYEIRKGAVRNVVSGLDLRKNLNLQGIPK